MRQGQRSSGRGWSAAGMASASLAAIVAGDSLAEGVPLGAGAALLLLLGLGLVVVRWQARLVSRWGVAAAGSVLLAAAALVYRPSPLAFGLGVTALLTLALGGRRGNPRGTVGWLARMVLGVPAILSGAWADHRVGRRWQTRRDAVRQGPRRLAAAWHAWRPALAAALSFIAIFAFANPIFAHGLRIGLREVFPDAWPDLSSSVTWLACGLGTWLLLRAHLPSAALRRLEAVDPERALVTTDGAKALRLLLAVNVVFAVQSLIDVRYLWAGATLPPGVTYSEFARHGAFLLMVAVLVSAISTLLLFGPSSAPSKDPICRLLALAWLAQNAFTVINAGQRLNLYVDAYGLTLMRLAAGAWMLLVLVGILLTGWKVLARKSHAWQLNANALATALVLLAVCFVDARGRVAWFNVRHPPRTELGLPRDPDLGYIASLGPAALPALRWWELNAPTDVARQPLRALEWQLRESQLRQELATDFSRWQGWSLERARLWAWVVANNSG